ncbi:peroxiredoxin family protein [Polaribacter sp. MSW13]|uniref:Peroxiredoxin family protein n=1 Tax=Polaribacter marinus TaxID=2916838 RepID=A0A9X1VPM8_9FLAO|nr:redoxin domain-containing protein [Polaribacter marinus]MCI2230031.1 peroxiredoxin family protein [Polaribacter marinus]
MNKKKILIIIIITIISLLSFLGYNITIKAKEKNQISKQLQTIPKFELKTLENISFSNADLKQNTSTIFIYFNSDCDFCHHEAESISQNLEKFKNVQFIFVSFEETEAIKKFAELYKLNNQENIVFLEDKKGDFSIQFNANSIPYILIYNQKNELVKKHKGQLNANGILRALYQND